jgi:hypothetical protein
MQPLRTSWPHYGEVLPFTRFSSQFQVYKGKNGVDSHYANQVSKSESPSVTLPIIQEQIQQLFAMLKPHSEGVSSMNQVGSPQTHLVPHMSGKILTSSNLSQLPQHSVFPSIYSF